MPAPGVLRLCAIVLLSGALAVPTRVAATPPAEEVVRYEGGRLTVSVVEAPLDRLLAQIAAATHVTVRGGVTARPVSIDFKDVPLSDALTRIFGAESFMLTYGGDGALRTIAMLGQRTAPVTAPPALPSASPRPPLSEEEDQAAVLQRTVGVAGPLAAALGSAEPPVGIVLHAVLQEANAGVRDAAREAVLAAFKRDPEIEKAYLTTLMPVEDATLAAMLVAMGPRGAAQEWMAALANRAPSMPLRLKATNVLAVLQQQR